jgi:hypothetical protein
MKPHTKEEKEAAMQNLPEPVSGFLNTEALTNIYLGIQKKFNLNLRELMIFTEIGNVTLMGLQPESALETNIHQWMPELSNATTHELVGDINDRVFKEAKRRLQENIIEPEPDWKVQTKQASELTPEEREKNARYEAVEYMADDDPELLEIQKKEEAEEAAWQAEQDKELEEALKQAAADPPLVEGADEELLANTDGTPEKEAIGTGTEAEVAGSVIDQKLGTVVQAAPVRIDGENITNTLSEDAGQELKKPEQQKVPPLAVQIPKKKYSDGIDPYREPIE